MPPIQAYGDEEDQLPVPGLDDASQPNASVTPAAYGQLLDALAAQANTPNSTPNLPAPDAAPPEPPQEIPKTQTASPRAPAAAASAPGAVADDKDAEPSDYDRVKKYLTQKYLQTPGTSPSDLALAQKSSADQQAQNAKFRAAATIGAAMSRGTVKPDEGFFNTLDQQAKQGVSDVVQRRAAQVQDLEQQKRLEDLVKNQVGNDPNSDINQSFKNVLAKIPSLKGVDLSGVTVNNAGPFQKVADAMLATEAKKLQAQQLNLYRQQMMDQRQDRLDQSAHQRNLQTIKKDPNLRARMTQYQNLDNALNIITNTDHLTPQQIDDFQQSLRSNLGIKGNSGVDERGRTYINTLGLNAARFQQLVTGDPANLAKDTALMQHLKNVAVQEQSNVRQQYEKSLNAATAGNGSIYARRPDLRQDINDLLQANRAQLTSDVSGASTAPSSHLGIPGGGAVPAGKIRIKTPDGKVGLIPQDKLQEALSHGATQVQ